MSTERILNQKHYFMNIYKSINLYERKFAAVGANAEINLAYIDGNIKLTCKVGDLHTITLFSKRSKEDVRKILHSWYLEYLSTSN